MIRQRISYGDSRSQFGHLYLPVADPASAAEGRPVPLVVVVHGGYWSTEFALVVETPVARDLAARGAVVWNVEYRRVGEHGGGWPRTGYDVANALSALDTSVRCALPVELAQRVAWDDVAVVGHSAGGQLALWAVARLGARTQTTRVRTVILQAAATDLEAAGQRGHLALERFIGAPYADTPHRYRDASPIRARVFDAHVVAIHGELDDAIDHRVSSAYVESVRARGQSAEMVIVAGEGHDAFVDPNSRGHRETLRRLGI
ncbi:S9 family peptidase [Williamsia sp. CHRR-6]|uniref:alpha/beta hydrolase family protein n=1 Tax=Williamsia sp. CHRR-6 TaxID=2835871 RepID=UPI001BD9FC9B|nr:alpha/beta hydrolase [Williamsia sp. CHRR-6]MBT0565385.1 alpha/beta hydrolase [Williamsia sp. CHRR-6]